MAGRIKTKDVAVNRAGTGIHPLRSSIRRQMLRCPFDTNVLGDLPSMRHELRVMLRQGSGSIINISSTKGGRGAPMRCIRVTVACQQE